jgi:hypothetical protein
MTPFEFEVREPPELIGHIRELAERFRRAALMKVRAGDRLSSSIRNTPNESAEQAAIQTALIQCVEHN